MKSEGTGSKRQIQNTSSDPNIFTERLFSGRSFNMRFVLPGILSAALVLGRARQIGYRA